MTPEMRLQSGWKRSLRGCRATCAPSPRSVVNVSARGVCAKANLVLFVLRGFRFHQRHFVFVVAVPADQLCFGFRPCALGADRACVLRLAGGFFLFLSAPFRAGLIAELEALRHERLEGAIEHSASHDVVRYLLAGFLSSRFACACRLQSDALHLGSPLPIVIAASRRFAMRLLPGVAHFMNQRRRISLSVRPLNVWMAN